MIETNIYTIEYGTQTINFSITYRKRKTLSIQVLPNLTVQVIAPIGATIEAIKAKVSKRASWISRQHQFFQDLNINHLPTFEYIGGETHRYLGRQYRLKIVPILTHEKAQVKLIGKYFHVFTSQKDNPRKTEQLLNAWYKTKAQIKFQERFDHCYQSIEKYNLPKPTLVIQKMKTRWGSWTPNDKILINPQLITKPIFCIDYVITHELCHVKHPNHSADFYEFLSVILPDWERRKALLNSGY